MPEITAFRKMLEKKCVYKEAWNGCIHIEFRITVFTQMLEKAVLKKMHEITVRQMLELTL